MRGIALAKALATALDSSPVAVLQAIQSIAQGKQDAAPDAAAAARAVRLRMTLHSLAVLAACLALGLLVYRSVFLANVDVQKRADTRRLEFFALSLEALLNRNEALPGLISLDARLAALLDVDSPATREAANRYLETVAKAADVSAAYVMDADGMTLAASNWKQPVTFVGHNYAFRPYFQEAMQGRLGVFYGVGVTSGEAGYFLASGVRSSAGTHGVVVVKIGLDGFENAMRQSGDDVFVADREGVILLSSAAKRRYRSLQPLTAQTRERLRRAHQYGDEPLLPLAHPISVAIDDSEAAPGGATDNELRATTKQPVGRLGWRMVMIPDPTEARHNAVIAATAVGFAAAFVIGLFMYLGLSRRRHEDRVAAQHALKQVNDDLERRIGIRTTALTTANDALARRVAELKRTEDILRHTRDSAVQAGKLAVLGQMSAGMSHELNQPLAALHTLSDNAIHLLQRGRVEETQENLALISSLAARMGRIVRQLKAFAHKGPSSLEAVDVAQAIEHALIIVEPRRGEANARIVAKPGDGVLRVRADAVRLEQVLVNLICNSLDAVAGKADPALTIAAQRDGESAVIRIRDSGGGISSEAMPRLFEPFFTTKPVGIGLGLGLALSLAIVEGFGGRIGAANVDGGAEFSIFLEAI